MQQQKQYKVLLIGDSCDDEYIYGKCERLNPEAPVPVMNYSKIETRAGMAANVCLNLQAFDIDVTFLTNSEKITKTRFIDEKSNQQLLRVDNEESIKPLILPVNSSNFDAIVISDYNKGYLTNKKIFEIVETSNIPIFIDSKKTILPNKENCFIKINHIEYEKLENKYEYSNIIVTKGSDGCYYKNTHYPGEKVNVYDVVGAGDTFLAALTYGYLKTNDINKALSLANRAASVAIQHQGTYVLDQKDVNNICNRH
jgi:D-beta-D-heptose 7-phosphate kinase/D-beta-D-heptose 1-phosphate adenosyltransferase